jgi:uncharacterized protein with PQ loop repeat
MTAETREFLLLLINIIPIIATVFMTYCYLPQITQTLRTKNVEGQNLQFWAVLNIALTLLLINSVLLLLVLNGSFGYMVGYIFNEGLALTMLILVKKYRNK